MLNENKLAKYAALLLKWNERINLIGRSTEADINNRHIQDSLQIVELVKSAVSKKPESTIVDFGSGGGLPGIVVAIELEDVSGAQIYLCESNSKKCAFLNNTIAELELKNIKVLNGRIENIKNINADIITARAFAELKLIFELAESIAKPDAGYILHKGENLEKELIEADKVFKYKSETFPSITGSGVIVKISDVARR